MLENLATIPWSTLRQCYGTGEDVPDLIRRLASTSSQERREAYANLWSLLWHQGSVYEASAAAVPFLCELLRAPDVRGKSTILGMIHAIGSDPEANVTVDPIWSPDVGYKFMADVLETARHDTQACRAAVSAEIDTFLRLLTDTSPRLRAGAALVLECCTAHIPHVRTRLRQRIDQEPNPVVKAVLIHVWQRVCKGMDSRSVNRKLRNLTLANDEKPIVRLTAALALASRLPAGPYPKFTRFLARHLQGSGQTLERLERYQIDSSLSRTIAEHPEMRLAILMALAERPTRFWRKRLPFELEYVCRERRSVFPNVVAVLGRLLGHDDAKFRADIALRLTAMGTWARFAREPLLQALHDSNPDVPIRAALALSKFGDPDALPFLLTALDPKEFSDVPQCEPWDMSPASKRLVRLRFLLDALRPFGSSGAAAMPSLRKLLKTGAPHIQALVAPALATIGEPAKEAVSDVARMLDNPATQDSAAWTLERWGTVASSAAGDLLEFLRASPGASTWCRSSAIGVFGAIGPPASEALPTLRQLLHDPDCGVKCRAAEAIWQIAPDDADVIAVLLEELKDKTKPGWAIHGCHNVLKALLVIGQPAHAAAPILEKLLGDGSAWHRIDAARILWKIGAPADTIVPVLTNDLLCRPLGIEAGRLAAECLAEIGPAARAALPRIREILARDDTFAQVASNWVESDEAYRNALTHALGKIDGGQQ